MNDIKSIPPSVSTMIERSLAKFCNEQGNQKLYYLLDSTESMRQFMIVQYGEQYVKNLVETELGKSILSKIKTYEQLDKLIQKSRHKINECEFLYNKYRNKKSPEIQNIDKIISKKLSPYQKELYFVFMVLLKISGNQNKIISRELLRTPEQSKSNTESFKKNGSS